MKIGVSTASLYPLHAEDAFRTLCSFGVKKIEVFANARCEGEEPCVSQICGLRDSAGVEITSFHPFSSPMESVYLFSTYDRRVEEMLEMYRTFFRSMQKLGAKIFVLHGAILSSKCTPEHYLKQFGLLCGEAEKFGVTVAQENVSYCLSGRLGFLKMMKEKLGERAKFVLDLKQARRSREDPLDYIKALGGSIVHCHISDADSRDEKRDCLAVGSGDFDFKKLIGELKNTGFDGNLIIELYRENYGDFSELKTSEERLIEIAQSV